MKIEIVKCSECGSDVEKPKKEITRSKKLKRPLFCNLTCSTTYHNRKITPEQRSKWNIYDISQHAGSRQDEYSPFRKFLSKSRFSIQRHGKDMDIDANYLKDLWNNQNGICPYTGISMLLPRNTKHDASLRSLRKASLDRIDSTKGYVKGNVEFVCMFVNLAKNSFPRKEVKEFLRAIDLSITQP